MREGGRNRCNPRGALLAFSASSFAHSTRVSHAGVMVSRDEVVHAYSGMGVILTRLREEPLASRPARFFRVNALVGA